MAAPDLTVWSPMGLTEGIEMASGGAAFVVRHRGGMDMEAVHSSLLEGRKWVNGGAIGK